MVSQRSPQLTQIDTHNGLSDTVFDSLPECDITFPSKAIRDRIELEQYQKLFDANMNHPLKPVCYDKTHVLLLSWAESCDDLKTEGEVDELASVFKDVYKFEVTRKSLEAERPQNLVNFYLAEFVKDHDKEHALLIIYYAGHGYSDGQDLLLSPTASHNPGEEPHRRNSIAWGSAEHSLKMTEADFLVIFDCCDAGTLWSQSRSPRRCFEFLGACEGEGTTPKPGPHSFTSALIWALKELRARPSFQSSELRKKIESAPNFSKAQRTSLFPRFAPSQEHIWITPHDCANSQVLEPPNGEYRDAGNEYLDLRFHFHHHLDESDIINTAKAISHLMNDTDCDFSARRVSLKRKYSLRQEIESIAHEWKQQAKKRQRISAEGSVLDPSPTSSSETLESPPQQLRPQIAKQVANEKKLDSSTLIDKPAKGTTTRTMVMYQERQMPHGESLSASASIQSVSQVAVEPGSTHTSILATRNDGVAYHFWMLLSRTTERGQAALGWVRDKITPSAAITLEYIRT
ncbi:hypothetical protein AOQ84DRAFT_390144 [Glonium stellatum]|uniref:Peptidase C14 caspase domain-containing protein n=1 Tax=Glonium stellatum TaxID=574774 RepID=A0A8E2EX24_9PEZI|nr:hypothetical protein AOQ84DRAFT_390144 [Glonium stellatum]